MDDNYEINKGTLALIPVNENITQVVEFDNNFFVGCPINKIIDTSCRSFGSTYIGRTEGTKALLGINYKAPIIISEANNIIFFPTASPRCGNCCWIALNNINNFKKDDKNTIINFVNDKEIKINTSSFIIENQIYKATMLESKLKKLTTN